MTKYGKSIPAVLLISLPIVIYLVYTVSNSASLFFADDFHLLKTVLWAQEANGVLAKLDVLIQQHNEHRILVPRLLTWLDYKIEGAINWKTLILAGNLIWAANLYFFWKGFKSLQVPVWMFVAIPFIFLQPQYTDNVTWAISILQQSVIVFWFSLFSYLCSKNRFNWALLIAIVATFTHGNGIFSFAIGIVIAALDRKWRVVIAWVLAWLVIGIIYFWAFRKGQAADFGKSLSNPTRLIASFFAFFGGITKLRSGNLLYPVMLGGILAGVVALYLLPKLKGKLLNPAYKMTEFDKMLLGIVLFLCITGALVSISRSWGGIESVLAPRYQHYSPFLMCWAYIVILSFLAPKIRHVFALAFMMGAIVFNALCYFTYNDEVQLRKNWLIADESNWANHELMMNYARAFNLNIKDTYGQVVSEGICTSVDLMPDIGTMDSIPRVDYRLNFSDMILNDVDASGVYPHHYQRITNDSLTGKTFVYLQPIGGKGYWIAARNPHAGIREFFTTGQRSKPGFEAEFLNENLPAGDYKVGLLNRDRFSWTTRTVSVK